MEHDEHRSRDEEQQKNGDSGDFFAKLFAPLRLLITIHLKIAAKELKEDSARLVTGIIFYFLGVLFFLTFLTLLNALVISGFYTFLFGRLFELTSGLAWFLSIAAWTGLVLLLALIFFAGGAGSFKKRFFHKTKELIEETWKELQ